MEKGWQRGLEAESVGLVASAEGQQRFVSGCCVAHRCPGSKKAYGLGPAFQTQTGYEAEQRRGGNRLLKAVCVTPGGG